jgi:hypothetical protein
MTFGESTELSGTKNAGGPGGTVPSDSCACFGMVAVEAADTLARTRALCPAGACAQRCPTVKLLPEDKLV